MGAAWNYVSDAGPLAIVGHGELGTKSGEPGYGQPGYGEPGTVNDGNRSSGYT